jgi:hypothetical protein
MAVAPVDGSARLAHCGEAVPAMRSLPDADLYKMDRFTAFIVLSQKILDKIRRCERFWTAFNASTA